MTNTIAEHRADAPQKLCCAVITVSDTRTLENDRGGALLNDLLRDAGHAVAERQITPDEPTKLTALITELAARTDVDAILLTGGTGISQRDQTFETVSALLDKTLPGYGELFRQLSFDQIGPAAMLSRTVGGVCGTTIVLTIPGSPAAVQLAMQQIILPELGHLVREARR
jgi:molybdenum cofactor biosynthesis protein B